jgi:hypothetical protein
MKGSDFDEPAFFRAVQNSQARALLIGRRALVALGLPVLTADYDFWVHIDDINLFNTAVAPFNLHPNRTADESRTRGRYVLENDERVDVLVARSLTTVDGEEVSFDPVWQRRLSISFSSDIQIFVPSLDDLIRTKRFGGRPKDLEDIRLLESLRGEERKP